MPVLKLSVALGLAFSCVCALPSRADEWTAYTYSAVSTTAAVKGMRHITDRVREETGSDLDIALHLGKTLIISSSDITQAVGDGVVDFAADFFAAGNVPITRVLSLPMLIENDAEWDRAYAAMQPFLKEGYAAQDVTYFGTYRYPQQVIFTTFPMQTTGDLRGRKIRVTSPEQGAFVSAFGGIPITLSGSDVPSALERGVIDGVLTASAGGAKNWHEFLPYNYRLPVNYGFSAIIANTEAYDALAPATRDILTRVVGEEVDAITTAFTADEEVQKQRQAEEGMQITEADPAEIEKARAALAPFWESWAEEAGPDHVAALHAVRAALGK